MYKIEKAKKEDYKKIADLYNSAHKKFINIYSKEEKQAGLGMKETEGSILEMTKTREVFSIKNKNNKILGFTSFRLKNEKTVWISYLYISPEDQGKGIGKILLDFVEDRAKEKKAKVVVLETHQKADWAINFYLKNKYKIINGKVKNKIEPFDLVLDKDPVRNRPILGKVL